MSRSRHTEPQILAALRDYQSGVSADSLCQSLGIHVQTLYRWKRVYGDRAESAVTVTPGPMRPVRRELRLPDDHSLEFCQQLLEFLNSTGGDYRLVLDGLGKVIEKA